jgi:hypothetical protein
MHRIKSISEAFVRTCKRDTNVKLAEAGHYPPKAFPKIAMLVIADRVLVHVQQLSRSYRYLALTLAMNGFDF